MSRLCSKKSLNDILHRAALRSFACIYRFRTPLGIYHAPARSSSPCSLVASCSGARVEHPFRMLARMLVHLVFVLLFLMLSFIPAALSVPQNVTCDDQNGCGLSTGGATITYSSSGWVQGVSCSGCFVHPVASNAYQKTWHDATLDPESSEQRTFDVSFRGPSNIPLHLNNVAYLLVRNGYSCLFHCS